MGKWRGGLGGRVVVGLVRLQYLSIGCGVFKARGEEMSRLYQMLA